MFPDTAATGMLPTFAMDTKPAALLEMPDCEPGFVEGQEEGKEEKEEEE